MKALPAGNYTIYFKGALRNVPDSSSHEFAGPLRVGVTKYISFNSCRYYYFYLDKPDWSTDAIIPYDLSVIGIGI
ncbi:MAG: hypothetical protein ACR2IS_00115 [Nitrososphaeraceae archaeon]